MQAENFRSAKIVIVVCLAVMLALAFFVKPPPPKTLTVTGVVAALDFAPQTGELLAMEITAGEADFLLNMEVPAAKNAPLPEFKQGQTVTIKVAAPRIDKAAPGILLCDYLEALPPKQ